MSSPPSKDIAKQLPVEIWKKILGYLPKYSWIVVALVNRSFNEVICEIERFKYPLVIKYQTVSNNN